MNCPAPQGEDVANTFGSGDPSFSLSLALRGVAQRAGYDINLDDLNAALGLSWMMTAVPGESDLARWSMYARDAFAVEAGRLFGLNLRPVHPPEAARGLYESAEFDQHFDAGYRPLILRALENGQPVLAWRGWHGWDPGGLMEMAWGIVERTCEKGIGLEGVVIASSASADHAEVMTLDRPPVQLYIAETVTPTSLNPDELLNLALDHTRHVFNNAIEVRFGAVTGPKAYDTWLARLRDDRTGGTDDPDLTERHRRLGASIVAGHESAIRFLQSHLDRSANQKRSIIEALIPLCQTVVGSIGDSLNAAAGEAVAATPAGRAKLTDGITRAREATDEMCSALESRRRLARPT